MLENHLSTQAGLPIKSYSTNAGNLEQAVSNITEQFENQDWAFLLIYFSPSSPSASLNEALHQQKFNCPIFGCSTAGEITDCGIEEDTILCLGFPAKDFALEYCVFENLQNFSIRLGQRKVRELLAEFKQNQPPNMPNNFAMLMIDGLSYREEQLVSTIVNTLDDIPLIGGSAADGDQFQSTQIMTDGRLLSDSAAILLVHCRPSIHIFKSDNFCPTNIKFVVTRADPENRIVYELNASPASKTYAEAIGLNIEDLDMMSFATHPLSVRVGEEYYARSIQDMLEDGAFRFYCAIDEGIVFTLTDVEDMRPPLLSLFKDIEAKIGKPQLILGFDCILRRLMSEVHQSKHDINEIFKNNRVIGFNTYGEQVVNMHLNQTFSGIAFGQ